MNAVSCTYPLQGEVGTTTRCFSAFSSQFPWTVVHSLRLQQQLQPGAPALTLSSLSTLEQMVRNLLSGTPQTANIPSRMRRSLTWGKGSSTSGIMISRRCFSSVLLRSPVVLSMEENTGGACQGFFLLFAITFSHSWEAELPRVDQIAQLTSNRPGQSHHISF